MTSFRQYNLAAIAIGKPRVRRCQQAPELRTKFEFQSRVFHHSSHDMPGIKLSSTFVFQSLWDQLWNVHHLHISLAIRIRQRPTVLLAPSRLALVPGGRAAMSDHSLAPESSIYAPQQRAAPGQQDDASPASAAVEPVTLLPGPAPPPPPFGVDPLIQPPRQRPAAPALNELPTAAPGANPIALWTVKADRSLQRFLDRLAPHQLYRWLGLGTFFSFSCGRKRLPPSAYAKEQEKGGRKRLPPSAHAKEQEKGSLPGVDRYRPLSAARTSFWHHLWLNFVMGHVYLHFVWFFSFSCYIFCHVCRASASLTWHSLCYS
jgi:hypothetical protein